MRIFSFGEGWGPYTCEDPGNCPNQAWACILSDEENNKLPKQSGPSAAKYILENGIGKILCDEHLDEATKQ